jgi:hypothetical protein
MPSDTQQHLVSPEAVERRHEAGDPSVRPILLTAVWIAGGTVVSAIIVWFGLGALTRIRPLDQGIIARGVIVATNAALFERFPAPELQLSPPADMAEFRAQESRALTNYAWIDRSNGIVQIPIDHAMNLLLQRGLPVRASNAPVRTGKSRYELIRERAEER